jgi:hypothetical protein
MKFDWKFAGLIVGLTAGLHALDTPVAPIVFSIAVCTVSNLVGFTEGHTRGLRFMHEKAGEFVQELQQMVTQTLTRAREVVDHERGVAAHLKARLAKYEDVEDDKPAVH